MFLASQTVQVTSEAKTRPIITDCTTMSADMNIDHGDRSRGNCALPITGTPAGAVACPMACRGHAAKAGTGKSASHRGGARQRFCPSRTLCLLKGFMPRAVPDEGRAPQPRFFVVFLLFRVLFARPGRPEPT